MVVDTTHYKLLSHLSTNRHMMRAGIPVNMDPVAASPGADGSNANWFIKLMNCSAVSFPDSMPAHHGRVRYPSQF